MVFGRQTIRLVEVDFGIIQLVVSAARSVDIVKVSIISFSYKRGLPKDLGEDGGGTARENWKT